MQDYTKTLETVNGAEVTVYGGAMRAVPSYHLAGHSTGWLKRAGARVTYAELTCTCHLVGELHGAEGGLGTWIEYGSLGWAERVNALALAHVHNVTRNGFMVRPAGGDRSRVADRHRVNELGLRNEMERRGLRYPELQAHLEDVKAGRLVTAEDGTRFELARDYYAAIRSERLPA